MDNNKIDKFTFYELYADILQGVWTIQARENL